MTDQKQIEGIFSEAEAEILDAINYLAMFLMKIRHLNEKAGQEPLT